MVLEEFTKMENRMNDLITVIIPVYNVEPYLERCIRSILNQTYRDIEIILVDDGSSDNSGKICDKYAEIDSRIKVIYEQNAGLGYARNSGLQVANGKYVVFVDSDDYAELSMVENLYRCLKKNNADTVIAGFRRAICSNIEIKQNPFAGKVFVGHDQILNNVLKKMLASDGNDYIEMSVWKSLFSIDIIKNNNIKFPDKKYLCEDIIFDFGYFNFAKKVAMSEDTGYCYCLNRGSLSQMYQKNKFERLFFQMSEMRRLSEEVGLGEEAFTRIDNFFIGNLIHHMKTAVACVGSIGRNACKEDLKKICEHPVVNMISWDNLERCYRGRDIIPFKLMKNNKPLILYYYFRLLTSIRSFIRK